MGYGFSFFSAKHNFINSPHNSIQAFFYCWFVYAYAQGFPWLQDLHFWFQFTSNLFAKLIKTAFRHSETFKLFSWVIVNIYDSVPKIITSFLRPNWFSVLDTFHDQFKGAWVEELLDIESLEGQFKKLLFEQAQFPSFFYGRSRSASLTLSTSKKNSSFQYPLFSVEFIVVKGGTFIYILFVPAWQFAYSV